jgi:aspartate--ammonia ligase
MRDDTNMVEREYRALLDELETERASALIRDDFQRRLADALNLTEVFGPLVVPSESGINDYLDGVMQPVSFRCDADLGREVEIVQSLAKWKRLALAHFGFAAGEGLLVNMSAIRPDEHIDDIHSIYVDQWDWEKAISAEQRTLDFLKETVKVIYAALRETERRICEAYSAIQPFLPETIEFVHTEDLQARYPDAEPRQREKLICQEHGAVFLIGIGARLADGRPHDQRAPDYDDWVSHTGERRQGLNGDIFVWNPALERAFELSSMGIRVDPSALVRQLRATGVPKRKLLPIYLPEYHRKIIADELPLSIGGGIGKSRLVMLLLRKAHIGEVQFSVWPDPWREELRRRGISLR